MVGLELGTGLVQHLGLCLDYGWVRVRHGLGLEWDYG